MHKGRFCQEQASTISIAEVVEASQGRAGLVLFKPNELSPSPHATVIEPWAESFVTSVL